MNCVELRCFRCLLQNMDIRTEIPELPWNNENKLCLHWTKKLSCSDTNKHRHRHLLLVLRDILWLLNGLAFQSMNKVLIIIMNNNSCLSSQVGVVKKGVKITPPPFLPSLCNNKYQHSITQAVSQVQYEGASSLCLSHACMHASPR